MMKERRNLRTTILWLALLGILAIAFGGFSYYFTLRRAAVVNADRETALQAYAVSKRLSAYISLTQRAVKPLGDEEELPTFLTRRPEADRLAVNKLLDRFRDALDVEVCYLLNRDGTTVASTNRNAPDSFIGKNYVFRPYFRDAIEGIPSVYMALGITSAKRGIYFSHPVSGRGEEGVVGVVVSKASVDFLEELLAEEWKGTWFLTSPDGIIFASNRSDWVLQTFRKFSPQRLKEIIQTKQFGRGYGEWIGLTLTDKGRAEDASGRRYILHSAPLENQPQWSVYYMIDLGERLEAFTAPLIGAGGYFAAFSGLLSFTILFLYLRGSSEITTKIREEKTLLEAHASELEKKVTELDEQVIKRLRVEEKLHKALKETGAERKKIEAILKSVSDALLVTDLEGRIVLMNPAAEGLFNCRLKDVSGIFLNTAIEEPALKDYFGQEQIPTGAELELTHQAKNEIGYFKAHTSMVAAPDGKGTGLVTILRDVTRERELDRMKSEFISTAAHELRTPLTSVKGYAQLLLSAEEFDAREQAGFLSVINEKTEVLEKIIDDLLNLSRVESGLAIQLEKNWYDLGAVLADLVSQYQKEHKDYCFETALPEKRAQALVDKGKFVQVMENLLSNAVKFSPEDSLIKVTCEVSEEVAKISVRDQGCGMTPEQTERVFDKFHRVDSSLTAKGGLGLGMSIAKNIVEAHGGSVWVESALGKGTTVTFTTPLELETTSSSAEER